MVRWAAAAMIAVVAGAWLGWVPAQHAEQTMPFGRDTTGSSPTSIAGNQRTNTIVDAFLAAQVVARLKASPDHAPSTEMLARLDVDGDGQLSDRDVALLVRRAVAVQESTS